MKPLQAIWSPTHAFAIVFAVPVAITLPSVSLATDLDFQRAALKGRPAFRIAVEPPPAALNNLGISRTWLADQAERACRAAGLPVDERAPQFLYVNAYGIQGPDNLIFYAIDLDFSEKVRPIRGEQVVLARTWHNDRTNAVKDASIVQRAYLDLLSSFTEEYLRANPPAASIK
jgi:hypothetical protein